MPQIEIPDRLFSITHTVKSPVVSKIGGIQHGANSIILIKFVLQ